MLSQEQHVLFAMTQMWWS